MKRTDEGTLRELLAFVTSEERVCPQPMDWQTLWEALTGARRMHMGFEPPPPFGLAGWWSTTNEEKAARLVEHIRWAAKHGAIAEAQAFLMGLPEVARHQSDTREPNC